MRAPTALAALMLLAVAADAQEGRKRPISTAWPPRPQLPQRVVVESWPGQPGAPIELRRMEVLARIVGLQVETTATMTFFNPNRRVLEGELQFPLPDGAIVTGYALDIRGQMVDGVVVKKEKARVAFETEVRRGVDPGLVEHVAGDVYRTRIYPLPALGERRIRVRYVAELPSDATGDAACLLAMPIGETVARLTIRVEVSSGAAAPEIGGFGNLRFRSLADLWVAETEVRDAQPRDDVWVALPKLPSQVAAVERTADGDVYFAVSDLYVPRTPPAARPARIGIAWDASGSRAGADVGKEIAALRTLHVAASLLVFRDRPERLSALGDPGSLEHVAYDGGTDLAAAADTVRASEIHDWLLFTDGLDTLSGRMPDFGDKNVVAVVSQTVADRGLLRRVCAGVVDLQRLDVSAILRPAVRLVRVHGTGIAEVQGVGAAAQGRVAVHGKLVADDAELRLEYSDGRISPAIRLSRRTATAGALLASVWAAERVGELSVRPDANEDELLALGRRFGVVSPATSLIVLESLDQYVRNEIEPPASLPELRRQWQESMALRTKSGEQTRGAKLDRVLAMWSARVAWWEATFGPARQITPVSGPRTSAPSPVTSAHPQGRAGTLAGRVTDGRDPLPGVAVTVTSPNLQGARIAVTTAAGDYALTLLPPGQYRVRFELPGFRTIATEATMGTAQGQRLDATMPQTPIAEQVTVTGHSEISSVSATTATTLERGVEGGVEGGVPAGVSGGVAGAVRDEAPLTITQAVTVPGTAALAAARPPAARAMAMPRASLLASAAPALDGESSAGADRAPAGTSIAVKAWDPATPYLAALKAAASADRYRVYLEQRAAYAASPAFFVDCAEFFLGNGDAALGVRVLTNLAEMKLEEASVLRVLAWRLQQAGELDRAIVTLRRVARLRPEEPQSHRDLALALAERGKTSEAMKLLAKVVMGEWDGRFPEIEVIALEELNALIARKGETEPPPIDRRLIRNLDADVRIVMSWDADATDVDIHVLEPSGEEAYYSHNRTASGGLVSRDLTQGYGPEEYVVRRALPGPYRVFANYYGSRQQTIVGPCTVTATVFTDFGRPTQKKRVMTLRLDKPNDRADIGQIRVGASGGAGARITEGSREEATPHSRREAFRAIRIDARAEEARRLVGEPQERRGDVWFYRVGDREYQIRFSDAGVVQAVIERLPGGAEMVLAQ